MAHPVQRVVARPSVERRLDPRQPVQLQVKVSAGTRPPATFLSQDLGLNGMFVRCPKPLAVGELVTVGFTLPRGGPISLRAQVAWNEPLLSGRTGMGLQFTEVPPDAAIALGRFLRMDAGSQRTVGMVDDDGRTRRVLRELYERDGVRVVESGWDEAEATLLLPHSLAIVGVNVAGRAERVASLRNGASAPLVVLLSGTATAAEWMGRSARFCFTQPADPEQVVRLSLSLVR